MDKRLIALTLLLLLGLGGNAVLGDLRTGLVANWQFEGNFNDSAGTNHGAPKGDAKIVTDAERGRVLELDGTGDYVEVPNSPSLNITGDQITLAAWVYHDDVTGNPEIIIAKVFNNTTHSSPYFSYGMHMLNPSGSPRVWISRTGGAPIARTPPPAAASPRNGITWPGVYNGAELRLFLDGKQVASSNVTGNIIGYDTVLRLGINGGLTEPMDGKMDDVRIYNRALSLEEIAAVMQGGGSKPELAGSPSPAATAVDVPADAGPELDPGQVRRDARCVLRPDAWRTSTAPAGRTPRASWPVKARPMPASIRPGCSPMARPTTGGSMRSTKHPTTPSSRATSGPSPSSPTATRSSL